MGKSPPRIARIMWASFQIKPAPNNLLGRFSILPIGQDLDNITSQGLFRELSLHPEVAEDVNISALTVLPMSSCKGVAFS